MLRRALVSRARPGGAPRQARRFVEPLAERGRGRSWPSIPGHPPPPRSPPHARSGTLPCAASVPSIFDGREAMARPWGPHLKTASTTCIRARPQSLQEQPGLSTQWNLLGEDVRSLDIKELEQLEKQLDSSLKHIRSTRYIWREKKLQKKKAIPVCFSQKKAILNLLLSFIPEGMLGLLETFLLRNLQSYH